MAVEDIRRLRFTYCSYVAVCEDVTDADTAADGQSVSPEIAFPAELLEHLSSEFIADPYITYDANRKPHRFLPADKIAYMPKQSTQWRSQTMHDAKRGHRVVFLHGH